MRRLDSDGDFDPRSRVGSHISSLRLPFLLVLPPRGCADACQDVDLNTEIGGLAVADGVEALKIL